MRSETSKLIMNAIMEAMAGSMEALVEVVKEEILADDEYLEILRDKLGKLDDEEQEEDNEDNEEEQNENDEEDNDEPSDEDGDEEEEEETQGYNSGQFVLTNGNGDIIIDEDGDEFNINAKEEVQDNDVYEELGAEGKGVIVDEEETEDNDFEEELKNKVLEMIEANADMDEAELSEEEIEMMQDPELLKKLAELLQQQTNFKFMERDPQEYSDIIDNTFFNFPTDLGGNDDTF